MASPEEFDVVVVGAGPAGSAAALAALAVNPDARVLMLDRSEIGRDKVCGDGIAPHAVKELDALGVTGVMPDEIVPSVRLVSPNGGSESAVTSSPGYVVPRAIFDDRLARAALERGTTFRVERVTALVQDPDGVTINNAWRAPIVIGADGANSAVRRFVGQPPNRGSAMAVAIRGYAPTPVGHPDELILRWDSRRKGGLCYAWAFPTSNGTTNVGYGMSSAGLRGGRAELEERLRVLLPEFDLTDVELTGHTLPLSVKRPAPAVGRVLLTGDAASLINPFTGEGIYSAIASGALAGTAAIAGPQDAGRVYAEKLSDRFSKQHKQTTALYPLLNSRLVLNTVVRASARDRRLFDRLLDVGLGDSAFRVRDVLRFGRHMF